MAKQRKEPRPRLKDYGRRYIVTGGTLQVMVPAKDESDAFDVVATQLDMPVQVIRDTCTVKRATQRNLDQWRGLNEVGAIAGAKNRRQQVLR